MTEQTYNGWTNRATWLTDLYFGDLIKEYLQEQINNEEIDQDTSIQDIADNVDETISSYLDEELESLSGFLKDMLDLSEIDYYDLAETYKADIEWL